MKNAILVFFLIFTFLGEAKAYVLYEYQRPVRALGMGGVYLPFVRATDAPTVNPAALAFVNEISWRIFNADLGAGVAGFANPMDARNLTNISTTQDYAQFYGKKLAAGAYANSSFAMPYFGFTAYDEFAASAEMHSPSYPHLDATFNNDYGGVFAFGIPMGPFFSSGIAVKRINRWGGQKVMSLSNIVENVDLQSVFQDKGVGYGLDTSVMFKVPTFVSPTLVVSWKDVGDTSFTLTEGTRAPDAIKSNLSAAAGISVDLPGLDLAAGVEYRHVNNNAVQLAQKLHLGAEISLPVIDLRAGISEGYPSYGIGLNLFFLEFNAAYWGVETGAYPGQSRLDRFQVGLAMQFSMDANFSIYSSDGKRRNLKQRR